MILLISILVGLLSLVFSGFLIFNIMRQPAGDKKMQSIALAIQEGASAFLKRQYMTAAVFVVVLGIIFFIVLGPIAALSFVLGAFLSALAGYIGMMISVRANVRTAEAARTGIGKALKIAFNGGAVNGFAIVGLGLLGVIGLYMTFGDPNLIIGFAFGASLISLFARIGGGIFTKAADVGADLVGKIEKGIPEDDPRNPAVIADNVGDNVGDCAGMGADLFESYVVTLIAAMLIAVSVFATATNYILFPIGMAAIGIIASFLGTFFVRTSEKGEKAVWSALFRGFLITTILSIIGFAALAYTMFSNWTGIFISSLAGLVTAFLIMLITEHFTSKNKFPVQSIAKASETGAGTNIITGMAVGLKSTILPVLVICCAILISFHAAGIYGIAIASMGVLAITAMVMSIDTYGPISDNAGGIAEMAGMPKNVREITDPLDAVGNTTKATTKGIAIASAAVSALALFAAYVEIVHLPVIDIMQTPVLVGLLIGAALPFLFSAFCMQAVGNAAFLIVKEVRRQFKDIKGIMSGKGKPDYAACVDIATKGALKEMIAPALLAVLSPIVVGFVLGPAALAGLIGGVIASGLVLALFLCNSGASWDNAKKYIEDGNHGGKGSDAHKAAIVGDTVGDPFKDTAGPAINPLIKVVSTISILLASVFLLFHVLA
ncbi:MAG: sodium-translocating pyrophosphatase [Candidatus Aenigmatarchaeota archaeon]